MAKSYLGSKGIKTIMSNIHSLVPKSEVTSDEVKNMWDSLDEPVIEVAPDGELSNWSYTLDEDNSTVTLRGYTSTTETDVVVYGKYQLNGKVYDTKIKSNDDNSTEYMFSRLNNVTEIEFKEGIDMSGTTNIFRMFSDCSALTAINGLENWDTSNVTNMGAMFMGCTSLTSLDLRGWDTSNVTNMYGMFYDSSSLTKILVTEGKWVISEKCDTRYMFIDCGVSAVTYA